MQGWQANPKTHLCEASSIRAMPETEKPPAMRGDIYFVPDFNFIINPKVMANGSAAANSIKDVVSADIEFNPICAASLTSVLNKGNNV